MGMVDSGAAEGITDSTRKIPAERISCVQAGTNVSLLGHAPIRNL